MSGGSGGDGHRDVDPLLGAWAVGGLDEADHELVERAIVSDGTTRERADKLARTMAVLDHALAQPPDPGVRARLLRAAADRWEAPPASTAVEVFSSQVEAGALLLHELDGDDWAAQAEPYDWSVHGLVAHLAVIEHYTASVLGLSDGGPAEAHHLAMGADRIAAAVTGPPRQTVIEWTGRARATAAAIADGGGPALDAPVTFHGWPFSVEGLLIARSFEIWTHADDIRRATGRAVVDPAAGDLRTMSSFSVEALPLLLPLVADDVDFTGGRVVLTGEGGGAFTLGNPEAPQVTVVTDVVDWCRSAARRIEPDRLRLTIEGDATLGHALLDASRVFAL